MDVSPDTKIEFPTLEKLISKIFTLESGRYMVFRSAYFLDNLSNLPSLQLKSKKLKKYKMYFTILRH